jgi:serine phosphatase RsbU (regulator of sigma subunit)
MAALSTKIRSEARNQYEIDALLQTVNNSTYNLASEEGFFATIVMARYWPQSGKTQLAIGGHLQPLWLANTGFRNLPRIKGISLGVTQDAHYEKKEISLAPGESILLFTDGVIEAENEDKELFGNERLVGFLRDSNGPPWGKGLLEFISNWRGNSSANDDLTILEIWRDEN